MQLDEIRRHPHGQHRWIDAGGFSAAVDRNGEIVTRSSLVYRPHVSLAQWNIHRANLDRDDVRMIGQSVDFLCRKMRIARTHPDAGLETMIGGGPFGENEIVVGGGVSGAKVRIRNSRDARGVLPDDNGVVHIVLVNKLSCDKFDVGADGPAIGRSGVHSPGPPWMRMEESAPGNCKRISGIGFVFHQGAFHPEPGLPLFG